MSAKVFLSKIHPFLRFDNGYSKRIRPRLSKLNDSISLINRG